MRNPKQFCTILCVLLVLLFTGVLCGFTTTYTEDKESEYKQKVSALNNTNEYKQEVTKLAITSARGCTFQVKLQVQDYYAQKGYQIVPSPYSGESGNYYTFKCTNDEALFPEYHRITVHYIGSSGTQSQGLCRIGQTCTAEIYSLISIQTDNITGCNQYVRNAVEDYYASKGVHVVKNPNQFDDNAFVQKTQYSFKCANDAKVFSNYKKIMAAYVGTATTETLNICKKGATCHTTIWSNADLGIEDVSLDIEEGRFIVSGLMYDDKDAWNIAFDSIQEVIVGITGLGVLICILAFVLQFIRLGATAGNPAERERVLKGIIWTGVGAVGCGAVTLIFSFAFNLI